THGLRALLFGPTGLRLNGRSVALQGRVAQELSDSQAREYRSDGVNTLVVPAGPDTARIWEAADRFGFLVIGRISTDPTSLALAASLSEHASSLGWLIDQDAVESEGSQASLATWLRGQPRLRVGIRMTRCPDAPLP